MPKPKPTWCFIFTVIWGNDDDDDDDDLCIGGISILPKALSMSVLQVE